MKERYDYIDALRGFTMLMVIYAHLAGIITIDGDIGVFCGKIMSRIRMPLFYFVSGFFAYAIYDWALFKRRVRNRLIKQLYPTIIVLAIYLIVTGYTDWIGVLLTPSKAGYWFTFCLFQAFMFFAIISLLMSVLRIRESQQKIIWSILFIISLAIDACIKLKFPEILKSPLSLVLSFEKTVYLLPYFYFGVICRAYINSYKMLFENYWLYIISCVLLILSYYEMNPILFRISGYTGIVVLFGLFFYLRRNFSSDAKCVKRLRLIGKSTLPIYLFHYFFIYFLSKISGVKSLSIIINMPIVEFVVLFVVSYIIAEICMMIDRLLLHYTPSLHRLILGA